MADHKDTKSKEMEKKARLLFSKDAEKIGMGGFSLEEAVLAAMYLPATATLPDPLKLAPGLCFSHKN